ncbi:unnamed protein product [Prunus armeniaca]|uniref:Uncharacterized protein n=1 Tax=Prunus armeniaca TaxID=36596 RepID=A0A6J5XRF8_PRUAR|nr:unnamed protein product [Prunus armeniaca]
MEPMNAPPAESPANLRRQTSVPLEEAGTNEFEELGLWLRFGLVSSSVSVSGSGFGESTDVVAVAATLSILYEVMPGQDDLGECERGSIHMYLYERQLGTFMLRKRKVATI